MVDVVLAQDDAIRKLRAVYTGIHQVLFVRSLEKAVSLSDLFDILGACPTFPVRWHEEQRRWVSVDLLPLDG